MLLQILINFVVIIFFATMIFLNTDKTDWYAKNYKDLSFMDSLYLCTTSFSSVGYGDISPATKKSKIYVIIIQTFILLEILSLAQYLSGGFNIGILFNILITYFVILVATLYFTFVTDKTDWNFPSSNDSNSFLNMFYFTNTTVTTCGYGEIVPITNKSRIPVMIIQSLIILRVLSLFT
uniref:Potassium channel domain-containing protein n=1 Tax=Pyramimonas orientalis virus TaxID=455367 RepID=A0A7M3UP32_POV01|nr:hypothetical protein HWQ62_00356 [Pyramimonas orientalis virus]